MKMFRLIGTHGIWKPLKVGEKYPFDYKLKGWTNTVEELAKIHPYDWVEIKEYENENQLLNISTEILKIIVSKNYDPVCGFANSYEDMVLVSLNLAKELIKKI